MAPQSNIYTQTVPLADALDKLLGALDVARAADGKNRLPQPVACPTGDAHGRVLSEFVSAAADVPAAPLAAAQGYALKAADTYTADSNAPALLQEGKTCFAVRSGDSMPPSCDAVALPVHAAADGKGGVSITAPMLPWLHVRRAGADMTAGETLFARNHILRPADLGALLAAGITEVQVWDHLQLHMAAVDSAVPASPKDGPAATAATDSIIHALAAQTQDIDCRAQTAPCLPASADAIRDFLRAALDAGAHALLLCAAGDDALAAIRSLMEHEGKIVAPAIGLLPGSPVMTAVYEGRPLFCLPASPAGSITAFDALVAPALLLMSRRPGLCYAQTLAGHADANGELAAELAASLPAHPGLDVFAPLALARVAEKTVALPLRMAEGYKSTVRAQGLARITADGRGAALGSTVRARPLRPLDSLYSTLFCAGGDDVALELLADELLRLPHAIHLVCAGADAADAVEALKNRHCHLAVLHMADDDRGGFNFSFVQKHWPEGKVALINLVIRQVGLVVPAGNPHGIKSVADIKNLKLRCVNRQTGSSTRMQFDALLRHAGMTPQDVSGYENEVESQLAVAAAVLMGRADCGPGVAAAARAMGLDFIPLGGERWDLAVPEEFREDPRVVGVETLLQKPEFKKRLEGIGGYDTRLTGQKLELGVRLGA